MGVTVKTAFRRTANAAYVLFISAVRIVGCNTSLLPYGTTGKFGTGKQSEPVLKK